MTLDQPTDWPVESGPNNKYMGCWQEASTSNLEFSQVMKISGGTFESCRELCTDSGWNYFALQRQGKCSCSDTVGKMRGGIQNTKSTDCTPNPTDCDPGTTCVHSSADYVNAIWQRSPLYMWSNKNFIKTLKRK